MITLRDRLLPRRNTAGWLTRKTAKAEKKATKAVSPNAIDGNGRKAVTGSSNFRRSIRIFPKGCIFWFLFEFEVDSPLNCPTHGIT